LVTSSAADRLALSPVGTLHLLLHLRGRNPVWSSAAKATVASARAFFAQSFGIKQN
jgi:hypothetical protein